MKRPEKITFGEMRQMAVRGVLIYCSDYKCSRSTAVDAGPIRSSSRTSNGNSFARVVATGARTFGRFYFRAFRSGATIDRVADREHVLKAANPPAPDRGSTSGRRPLKRDR
jgi:hypothetical protein